MTVTDELALLLHAPSGRRLVARPTLPRLLGGAQLVDLVLAGRVALAGGRSHVQVLHRISTGDPVLDVALDRVPAAATVPAALAALRPGSVERVMTHLVAAGAVTAARPRVSLLVRDPHWPSADPTRRAALVARLRATLLDGAAPTDRDAALAALLDAGGALPGIVGGSRRALRRRATEIATVDGVPAAARQAVVTARAVRLAVVATGAATAGRAGG
ncbi:GOLPH3/VPS74 family protein [Actinomycetospora sp. CA-084318]|uniref:GOLPH3/VPS74 family protein n=1 Tax=Actinomycetospora sp. CA-084318 TaxID=3239892 RepID=UPI003D98069D